MFPVARGRWTAFPLFQGKRDASSVKYLDPRLGDFSDYGCMVYQEQVMQIVRI
ncbi:MAG: hypothetical protein ACLT0Y_06005 [Christensenellales bacterium]